MIYKKGHSSADPHPNFRLAKRLNDLHRMALGTSPHIPVSADHVVLSA